MKRFLKSLVLGILLALPWAAAQAQQVNTYCWVDAGPPVHWSPCNSTNPLAVTGTFTPSGTQNVNLTQILSAAPSLTNPLWVFPATGATFPVSGTVTANQGTAGSAWPVTLTSTTITGTVGVTQSTSPWVVTGSGTAGTAATGVVTIQGIAAMTKLLVTPDSVALPANQSVNVSQINGITPLMGNGTTGTGSQRVTIASDNTAFSVNATLSAETTKIIGTVNQGTSPWVVSGTVTGAAGLGITPTDRTITSASGSSQQIMAANASRHSLTIVNTGSANCGVNPTGGTAAIGGAGTITLVPTGSYTPRVPTLSAVTVICTSTQPIYGDES